MAPIAEECLAGAMTGAIVRDVSAKDVISATCAVKEFDLLTATPADLDFTADFRLDLRCCIDSDECSSVVLWFDTPFSGR
eukprot:scaffold229835_cov37-Prasinocladus_malaysianus.AAC.1